MSKKDKYDFKPADSENEDLELKGGGMLILSFFVMVIFIAVVVGVPAYFKSYGTLGEDKALFFMGITFVLATIALAAEIIFGYHRLRSGGSADEKESVRLGDAEVYTCVEKHREPNVIRAAVLFFLASSVVTFAATGFNTEAFTGFYGWRMGLAMTLACAEIFFLMSKFMDIYALRYFATLTLIVSVIHIAKGNIAVGTSTFVPATGQNNWYTAMMAVYLTVTLCLYLAQDDPKLKGAGGDYYLVCFFAGCVSLLGCGSTAAYLVLLICFAAIIFYTRHGIRYPIMALAAICLALPLAEIRFGTDINVPMTAVLALTGVAVLICGLKVGDSEARLTNKTSNIGLGSLCCGAAVLLAVFVSNSFLHFSDIPLLTFSDSWGSDRGYIWKACVEAISNFNVKEILFGVGQDMLYTVVDATEYFGGTTLTAAHNIWLNRFITQGLFGVLSWAAVIISIIYTACRGKRYVFVFPVLAYLAVGMVSFDCVLNFPYIFILAGILDWETNAEALTEELAENGRSGPDNVSA